MDPESAACVAQLSPELRAALGERGYTTLTAVQKAMLDPELAGRDLRITSQTGSGKTLAFAFALEAMVRSAEPRKDRVAHPRALVIVPTRELAAQVQRELAWAFARIPAKVAVVAGGASYQMEARALSSDPRVIVGTPGRLVDHLERGSIDTSQVAAVVLDEADQMLDLGFRESLEAILTRLPEERRTHLVSATFAHGVLGLAKRFQKNPSSVEGTRLGAANADIEHVAHLVPECDYVSTVINLLLANPDEQALVFARTRADVAAVAEELLECGFAVAAISGEMQQVARNRSLGAFRSGNLRVLVATDVAARGIDVNIARVIQIDPPGDAEDYTHRSGRTGRAGRTGTSVLIASTGKARRILPMLARAGIHSRIEHVPTAAQILKAADDRFIAQLFGQNVEGEKNERLESLAKRIVEGENAAANVARLLSMVPFAGSTAPREVRSFVPPPPRPIDKRDRPARPNGDRYETRDRPARAANPRSYETRDRRDVRPDRPNDGTARPTRSRAPVNARVEGDRTFVPFSVNWGAKHGADPRRLLAIVCRRGNIRGTDVGAIRIGPFGSTFEVDGSLAEQFASAAKKRDPRDPKLLITPARD